MKSEEYLESKKHYKLGTNGTEFIVSLEHAKTYGKIVELDLLIKQHKEATNNLSETTNLFKKLVNKIEELESEIDKLMKL